MPDLSPVRVTIGETAGSYPANVVPPTGLPANTPNRFNARVVATGNISLSGTPVIDGYQTVVGDRVLAIGQTTASANGVYVVAATGSWQRAIDLSLSSQFAGPVRVSIELGTVGRNKTYEFLPSSTVVIGTTSLVFTEYLALAYLSKRRTMSGLGITEGLGASQSSAITTAFSGLSAGDFVDGQNRTYRIDTSTVIPSGIILENIVFDTTQSGVGVYPLELVGSLGTATAVSTSLTKGVYQIVVGSTAGMARGDDVIFVRSGYSAGAGFGADSVRDTWWTTIDTVIDGTNLILREAYPHNWSMPTSPGTLLMYRPTMMRDNRFINVSCLRSGTPTNNTNFFRAQYARNMTWEGGTLDGPRESAIAMIRGRNWRIRDTRAVGQNQEGLGYPIAAVNGNEDFWIMNNVFVDCRHGVTVGGTDGIDRNGFISRNVVRGARSAAIDVHPNAENITIDNNKIYLASKERDILNGGNYGNNEGITYQGANAQITNNEIYGLSGSNTAVNDRPGIFLQFLTRQPQDTAFVVGNRVTNFVGAGVICIYVQNQKSAGDIETLELSQNHVHAIDAGGAGALSPIGIGIESTANGTEFYNINLTANNIRSRSTALRVIIGSTRYLRSMTIMGGQYETINNDAPVLDFSAGASNRIERVSIVGPNLLGGSFSIRNVSSNSGRITWTGGTAGGFATAATSGTVTQPAGAVNEIRT